MTWNSGTQIEHPPTNYTPSWTASTTNPSGWTLVVGRYHQIGKLVICRNIWQAGTSASYGYGTWTFTLPVTARAISPVSFVKVGEAYSSRSSDYAEGWGSVCLVSTTTAQVIDVDGWKVTWGCGPNTTINVDQDPPPDGSRIHLSFFYEAA